MPMSPDFEHRLYPLLPRIIETFGTPFHIYDETGIIESGVTLKRLFAGAKGFREYFAVKALPNLAILRLLRDELGYGFDCSSLAELELARLAGAGENDTFFTSNNTTQEEFCAALAQGCILNLDDASFVEKVPEMPELICFRYNPGATREGTGAIGK